LFFGVLECEVPALAVFGPGSVQLERGVTYGEATETWRASVGTSMWKLRVVMRDDKGRPRPSQFKRILEDMVRGFDVRVVYVEGNTTYERAAGFLVRVERERGEVGAVSPLGGSFRVGSKKSFCGEKPGRVARLKDRASRLRAEVVELELQALQAQQTSEMEEGNDVEKGQCRTRTSGK
jgi:hypothetical protein